MAQNADFFFTNARRCLVNNVISLFFADESVVGGRSGTNEPPKHTPHKADDAKYVEDRWPTAVEAILTQVAAKR